MKSVTTVKPLITNFMFPKKPEIVSEGGTEIIYDSQTQITIYMGGGKSGPSRSYDQREVKDTKGRYGSGTYYTKDDRERYTDD